MPYTYQYLTPNPLLFCGSGGEILVAHIILCYDIASYYLVIPIAVGIQSILGGSQLAALFQVWSDSC